MSAGSPASQAATRSLAEVAHRRALGWGALALGFYEPTPEWVQALRSGRVRADLTAAVSWLDVDGERFEPHLALLAAAEQQAAARPADEVHTDLSVEYARLFIGPGRAVASPYESVWCDTDDGEGQPLVHGPSTVQVEEVYARYGVRMAAGRHDLADHVASELEFLHFLCRQEEKAWHAGGAEDVARARSVRADGQQFLRDHLGRFLPDVCEAVGSGTVEDVYRALAGLATEFLSIETGSDYASTVLSGVFSHATP